MPSENSHTAIVAAIKTGDVTMKSKRQLWLQRTLIFLGGVLVLLGLLYVLSLMVFVLRHTGVMFVPGFGAPGVLAFILGMPWLLVSVALVFLVVLEMLVRRYSFAYQKPLVYSVGILLLVTTLGGYAVANSTMHDRLIDRARDSGVPVLGPLYRSYDEQRKATVHVGTVVSQTPEGFVLQPRRGDSIRVRVTEQTKQPRNFSVKDDRPVVVFGSEQFGVIDAKGVRSVPDDHRNLPPRPSIRGDERAF